MDLETLPTEIVVLGWSVLLLFAHIAVQGYLSDRERGLAWNAGARDGDARPLGVHAARAQRALDNFKESWPAFIALALALAVMGREGGAGATGAWIWFGARVAFLPLYLGGVPWLRTIAWGVSIIGLLMMLARLF